MFPVAIGDNPDNFKAKVQISTAIESDDFDNGASTSVDEYTTYHNSGSNNNNGPSECPIAPTVDTENEKDKTPASILCDNVNTPAETANNNDSGDSSNKVLVESAALLHSKDVLNVA